MIVLGKEGHIISGGCGAAVLLGWSLFHWVCVISLSCRSFKTMLQADVIQNTDPSGLKTDKAIVRSFMFAL